MIKEINRCLATFFYVGFFPKAPGSLAALCGTLIAIALHDQIFLYILVAAIMTLLGFYSAGKMEKIVKEKDPSCVVIDEVAGSMIAFFLLPLSWPIIWTGFFLFRAFDMFKIYPVNKLEAMHGGAGIMMDDLFAGLYTNLTMQIALRMAGII